MAQMKRTKFTATLMGYTAAPHCRSRAAGYLSTADERRRHEDGLELAAFAATSSASPRRRCRQAVALRGAGGWCKAASEGDDEHGLRRFRRLRGGLPRPRDRGVALTAMLDGNHGTAYVYDDDGHEEQRKPGNRRSKEQAWPCPRATPNITLPSWHVRRRRCAAWSMSEIVRGVVSRHQRTQCSAF